MIVYKNKYLKYKIKYMNAKRNIKLRGGSSTTDIESLFKEARDYNAKDAEKISTAIKELAEY